MASSPVEKYSIVILAAGKGKRMMNDDLPKVLVELEGKPLIGHVLGQTQKLPCDKTVIIVGHRKEKVTDYVNSLNMKNICFAEQAEQLGTGHAVRQAEPEFEGYEGNILILCGDVPLLRSATIDEFIEEHNSEKADVSVLSTLMPNPSGYGRIVRDENGAFLRIVEQKDANESEKEINEINSGIFFVKSRYLFDALKMLSNNNSQGEYYLTDIIGILSSRGLKVQAVIGPEYIELQGINSPDDLERAKQYYNTLNLN